MIRDGARLVAYRERELADAQLDAARAVHPVDRAFLEGVACSIEAELLSERAQVAIWVGVEAVVELHHEERVAS